MAAWGHRGGERDWRAGPPRGVAARAGEGREGKGGGGRGQRSQGVGLLIFDQPVAVQISQRFQRLAPSVRLAASDWTGEASLSP